VVGVALWNAKVVIKPYPAPMHYPKVVSAATGDRSHTIAAVSLRAQNSESLNAISRSEIAFNITIQPLDRSAGEGAGG
jgi:hypothetical protein